MPWLAMTRRGASVLLLAAFVLGGCARTAQPSAYATGPHGTYTYRDLQSVRSISAP